MDSSGKFQMVLEYSAKGWRKFTSRTLEMSGFQWHVTGEFMIDRNPNSSRQFDSLKLKNVVVSCEPANGKNTACWASICTGDLYLCAVPTSRREGKELKALRSEIFSVFVDFRHPASESKNFEFPSSAAAPEPSDFVYNMFGRRWLKMQMHFSVARRSWFDFAHPVQDAMQFVVEGARLWMPKSKSPDTAPVHLEGIKLADFVHFLSIIHGYTEVDSSSVPYLLQIEETITSKAVNKLCQHYLLYMDGMPPEKKLVLCEKHKLHNVSTSIINEIDPELLRNLVREMKLPVSQFSHHTLCAIVNRQSL